MSTQEREAMEEVRAMLVLCDSEFSSVGHGRPPSSSAELIEWSHRCRSLASSVQKWINAHARSLQPITVEGLVAMGFTRADKFGEFWIKAGAEELSVSHHNGRFSDWMWGSGRIAAFSAPQTMLDLDWLIERLSR